MSSQRKREVCFFLPSKYQKNQDEFLRHFMPLIDFPRHHKIYLFTLAPKEVPPGVQVLYGNYETSDFPKTMNLVALKEMENYEYYGHLSDDVRFTDDWFPTMMKALETHQCVSPGYYEGRDVNLFQQAVTITQGTDKVMEGFYGAMNIYHMDALRWINGYDETIEDQWHDLDVFQRMLDAKIAPVITKKIIMQHYFGYTRRDETVKVGDVWRSEQNNSEKFIVKYGREKYVNMKNIFKRQIGYFQTYKRLANREDVRRSYLENLERQTYGRPLQH